jgi:cytochrome c peroxidase
MKNNKLIYFIGAVFFFTVTLFASCKKDTPLPDPEPDNGVYQPTPYQITIPPYFPTILNIPDDNPMTVEGIELGRILFYDGRLGGRSDPDSLICCSTCHVQENAFECGIDNPNYPGGFPHGVTGIPTPHVMLPLFNVVWNSNGYLWNGSIWSGNPNTAKRKLEDLCWMGVYAPHEMHSDSNRSKALIGSIAGYKPLFKKAFGTEDITFDRISRSISQFIRSIVSADSKFDKYLRGEVQLDNSELNGYVLFVTEQGADCFHCHGGGGNPLFTTNLFYNNAKDTVFTDTRDRYAVTGDMMDIGAYRAPTLRNIELTGPYMHDGRYATLDAVINFYSDSLKWSPSVSPLMHKLNFGGAHLLPQQKADLKAFLLTLTDYSLISNPAYACPSSFPE